MINTESFIESLIEYGYEEFIGVPCSNLTPLINYTSNLNKYVSAANEGDAVAYASGAYLAGKKVAVLMQNSGLMNALSPLTSLNEIYKIPVLMLIGYRGGDNDEPQHKLTGSITESMLSVIGNDYKIAVDVSDVKSGLDNMYAEKKSLAYLVRKGDFSEVRLKENYAEKETGFSRSDVLESINDIRDDDTVVITTTGFISREMYDKYGSNKNFYMVGSMGCAISIGNGIARHKPDKKVIVVDGDGSFLMRPSGAFLYYETKISNLIHIIIDNASYESTGGQIAVSSKIDIGKIVSSFYDSVFPENFNEVNSKEAFSKILKYYIENINNIGGVKSMVCKINKLNDNKLGRLKESCEQLADLFMYDISLEK